MKRIIKANNDYVGISWVLKARSNEQTRYNLNFVDVKNGEVIATDGKRLHIYKPEMQIDDGNYEIITINKNEIILEVIQGIQYPDWEAIFPRGKPTKTIEIQCYPRNLSGAYTNLVRIMREEKTVDLKYFEDINQINNTVIFSVYGEDEAIQFASERYRGLVMPMKIGF